MIYLLQLVLSFCSVFAKGFQNQNVIGGKFKGAFIFSYIIALFDVGVITTVASAGWQSIVPVGTGAAFGIVCSMLVYRRIHNRKAVG